MQQRVRALEPLATFPTVLPTKETGVARIANTNIALLASTVATSGWSVALAWWYSLGLLTELLLKFTQVEVEWLSFLRSFCPLPD